MTAWHAWVASCAVWGLNTAGIAGVWLAAIWTGDERLGFTGLLMLGVSIVGGIALGVWSDSVPDKPLPRKQRKALKRERARVVLEQKIRDLEVEAGLRGSDPNARASRELW